MKGLKEKTLVVSEWLRLRLGLEKLESLNKLCVLCDQCDDENVEGTVPL